VTVTHASAQQVLQGHVGAIVTDLRHAALPVSRLTIEQSSTSGGSFGSSTAQGDSQTSSRSAPQRESPSGSTDDDQPRPLPATPGRVRIVL
jgi:hypothetical protein